MIFEVVAPVVNMETVFVRNLIVVGGELRLRMVGAWALRVVGAYLVTVWVFNSYFGDAWRFTTVFVPSA